MFVFFGLSLFWSYLIYAWFHTDAFEEYSRLFKLDKFSKTIKVFLEMRKSGMPSSFPGYLAQNKDCFFVRLITCSICLSLWGLLAALPVFLIYIFFNFWSAWEALGFYISIPFFSLLGYRILNKLK